MLPDSLRFARAARLSAAESSVLLEIVLRLDASGPDRAVAAGGTDLANVTGHARQTTSGALSRLTADGVLRCHRPPVAPSPGYYTVAPPQEWGCGFRNETPGRLTWTSEYGPLRPNGEPAYPGFRAWIGKDGGAS